MDCLDGKSSKCYTCTADNCNENNVFPEGRLQCHQCDSRDDATCTDSPNFLAICPVYAENDNCVSTYHKGVTKRGCASSLKCDNPKDRKTCKYCSENGCNTVNLENANSASVPGLWQPLPLTCYSCDNEEDCNENAVFKPCFGENPEQSCMTVFSDVFSVLQRGCSDAVLDNYDEYCNRNPDSCVSCNSNGCNDGESLVDYIDCVTCDSHINPDCVLNVNNIKRRRSCHGSCMTALFPLGENRRDVYALSRSCADDKDLDDFEICAAGKDPFCVQCDEENCNVASLPQHRHQCYTCEGDMCQDPTSQLCPYYMEKEQCYMQFDEQHSLVAMGCYSQFDTLEGYNLQKEKRLLLCSGKNCNNLDELPPSQQCVLCNSRSDSNCAVAPNNIKGDTQCTTLPHTSCYTRITENGDTERGCLSSLEGDVFMGCLNGDSSTSCAVCSGDNCNKEVFPANRLQCHVCDSSTSPECKSEPNNLAYCEKYDPKDTCVTALVKGNTIRGCSSALDCTALNAQKCVSCKGSGCNTVDLKDQQDSNYGLWQDLPLKCLECEGENCADIETLEPVECTGDVNQNCMTIFEVDKDDDTVLDKVIQRGCSGKLLQRRDSQCTDMPNSCFECKSNNCNTARSLKDFQNCYYCNSKDNPGCVDLSEESSNAAFYETRKCQGGCMTALYKPKETKDTSNAIVSYDLIRTCLDDKEEEDRRKCVDNKDSYCKSCVGDYCNSESLPEQRLSCFMCEEDCTEPTSSKCPKFLSDDACFTQFNEENTLVAMGCLSSLNGQKLEQLLSTKTFGVCSLDNCNDPDKLPKAQLCAVCNSNEDVDCAVNPNEISQVKSCTKMPQTACFTKLNDGKFEFLSVDVSKIR